MKVTVKAHSRKGRKVRSHSRLTKSQRDALKHSDKLGEGAKKRKALHGKAKIPVVMHEFNRGTLKSGGSGEVVTNPKQAIAIAMSEAGMSKKKRKKK